MFTIDIQVRNVRTKSGGKQAINDFLNNIKRIPARVTLEVPATTYNTAIKQTRQAFTDNYVNKKFWEDPNFGSRNYMHQKNTFLRRGDSFTIGTLGTNKVLHGAEVFGRRTDTIYRAAAGGDGSFAKTEMNVENSNNTSVKIHVGFDRSKWDGGNIHQYTTASGQSREIKQTVNNQLDAFSGRISNEGSVLVKLSAEQRRGLAEGIGKVYKDTLIKMLTSPKNVLV